MECKYCTKECKPSGLINHQTYCKLNPDRKSRAGANNPNYGKNGGNQFTVAASEGRTIEVSAETRAKLGKGGRERVWTEERRNNHSTIMANVAANNPSSYSAENIVGRVSMHEVTDGFGNLTKVRGSWELNVALWLNTQGIMWTNHIEQRFMYYWEGATRRYYPDFYLPEFNLYIEVKGYETERDHAKWEMMTNLVVIKRKEYKDLLR